MANTATGTVSTVVIGPGRCATCGGQIGEAWSYGDLLEARAQRRDDFRAEQERRRVEGLPLLDVEQELWDTTVHVMRHCGVGGHNAYPFPVMLGEIEDAFKRRGYTAYIR